MNKDMSRMWNELRYRSGVTQATERNLQSKLCLRHLFFVSIHPEKGYLYTPVNLIKEIFNITNLY